MKIILYCLLLVHVVVANPKPHEGCGKIHSSEHSCDGRGKSLLTKITEIKIVKYYHYSDDLALAECDDEKPTCDTILCTADYTPICAVGRHGEKKVFGNQCELDTENCLHPNNAWVKVCDGECEAETTIPPTTVAEPVCNRKCPRIYFPICASDGMGNRHDFSNQCVFDYEICSKPQTGWIKLFNGECSSLSTISPVTNTEPDCPEYCPGLYAPICASDATGKRKVYDNECYLRLAICSKPQEGWFVINNGQCEAVSTSAPITSTASQCSLICPAIYSPVCASDSSGKRQVYENDCRLKYAICSKPQEGWIKLFNGECESISTISPVTNTEPDCPEYCPGLYAPICASDATGKRKVYDNECYLRLAICSKPQEGWFVINNGQCEAVSTSAPITSTESDCPVICPQIYSPVCASDSSGKRQVYENDCRLKYAICSKPKEGWIKLFNGECSSLSTISPVTNTEPDCPEYCPGLYAPICASDATGKRKVYDNECYLRLEICSKPQEGWFVINNGQCEAVSTSAPITSTASQCSLICPAIYSPVCASDSSGKRQVYENDCRLKYAICSKPQEGWIKLFNGECSSLSTISPVTNTEPDCPEYCPGLYAPICASDATGKRKVYDNECYLRLAICSKPQEGWFVINNGQCEAVSTSAPITSTASQCSRICPAIYSPVCASDSSGKRQVYENDCRLKYAICSKPQEGWIKLFNGECDVPTTEATTTVQCNMACPDIYDPVCGADGTGISQTFASQCDFEITQCKNAASGWTVLRTGECSRPTKPTTKCSDMACPDVYSPICAVDNSGTEGTFSNSCQMGIAACESPEKKWTQISKYACGSVGEA